MPICTSDVCHVVGHGVVSATGGIIVECDGDGSVEVITHEDDHLVVKRSGVPEFNQGTMWDCGHSGWTRVPQ